ncbi:biotin--[acetyl-CoA-carboxylase] ligase [Algoriphagus sp.]|uniref:biotin--[acetyl-CoA-carboxylase] ligase n=1 Tax=Algoriphagus sp. TaxID=1872435 RepID=UPI0025F5AF22|nr:biotin--[acetyl-CoA-carboxylase] ligase [Algoriphagus sp.]
MYKILANTIFLGKDVHFLPDCHSTNDIALQMVRQGSAAEGTIVICDHQIKGKGQRGNVWLSQAGLNLTFSLILRPTFLDITEQFSLNMCVSNGIKGLLEDYLTDVKVKWPNDIVVPGYGKIGGVLVENTFSGSNWEYSIVGIGLNINQKSFLYPKATSMSLITENIFDLKELFRLLISRIEQSYLKLKRGKLKEIKNEYLNHLYLRNQKSQFQSDGEIFTGEIKGVTSFGKLQIETEEGELRLFDLKEVIFLE